jgi:methionine-gamma-lyase
MGADVVFHSMTKFINGHADIVAGMIVTRTEELYKKLRSTMVGMGCNMDPHQAFLVHRGVKTLSLRVERAQENAIKVAHYLENHPKIAWVKYPGLKSHPQFELAQKQMKGPGSMISFELKGGFSAGEKLMNNVHLALLAVSLGGVESLIQHPASMTHSKMNKEAREKAKITDGLVRFAVGIENVEDIIDDLDQALAKV